jgi:hypothetical protein
MILEFMQASDFGHPIDSLAEKECQFEVKH